MINFSDVEKFVEEFSQDKKEFWFRDFLWNTSDGRTLKLKDVSDQHLSNIKIFLEKQAEESVERIHKVDFNKEDEVGQLNKIKETLSSLDGDGVEFAQYILDQKSNPNYHQEIQTQKWKILFKSSEKYRAVYLESIHRKQLVENKLKSGLFSFVEPKCKVQITDVSNKKDDSIIKIKFSSNQKNVDIKVGDYLYKDLDEFRIVELSLDDFSHEAVDKKEFHASLEINEPKKREEFLTHLKHNQEVFVY